MKAIFSTPLAYVVMFAPLIVAIVFSFKIAKMPYKTALGVFVLYSALMGLSLSFIFLVYTGVSILRVFFITSATFAAMSLYGYTTKKDLTSIGSFLIMALFGVVIASIVNIFLKSSGLQFALSLLSVFIFIGLTAYDTQKIKEMYFACDGMDMENAKKVALMGSLSLYMDFINLFIALLRFFGDKKE
jgi:FtsH-binding integral membrane protein